MELLLQVATNWILPVLFFLVAFGFGTMIIVEGMDSMMRWKARLLDDTIKQILGDDLAKKFWDSTLANPLGVSRRPSYISASVFATFIMHWLILDCHVPLNKPTGSIKLSKDLFDALQPVRSTYPVLDTLLQGTLEPTQMQEGIRAAIEPLRSTSPVLVNLLLFLLEQAQIQSVPASGYYDHFHKGLEDWFADATNQLASQYKRLAQKALLIVGMFVAAVANFDIIAMVSQLWRASLLKELVDIAQKTNQPVPEFDPSLFTSLPLGWSHLSYSTFLEPTWLFLKVAGIIIGGFLIFISAQYIFEYVKRRTNVPIPSGAGT